MSDKKRLLNRKAERARASGNPVRIAQSEQACSGIEEACSGIEKKKAREQTKFENKMKSKLAANKLSKKQFWKATTSLLGRRQKSTVPPIRKGEGYVTESTEKSTVFTNYFVSEAYVNDQNHRFPEKPPFQNDPLSKIEILHILNSLDPNKATGPDEIGNALLRIAALGIHKAVCKLVNLSLSLGQFPSSWKLANVVPIFKKGDTHNVSNYRPVSLLSCLPKLAERVVAKRLRDHLNRHSILNPMQSGFRRHHSTQTQLTALLHDIGEAIDSGKKVRAAFLDISKAFDRVSHRALLITLRSIGASESLLSWLQSYLTGRKQRVSIDGKYSAWQKVLAGVPQGSVLGPLLFIIFINDLITKVDRKIRVYADDTMLFECGEDQEEVNRRLEENLLIAESWGKEWLVDFNQSKTVVMTFGDGPPGRPLSFKGSDIDDSTEHTHLGVVLQSNLKWSKHISMISEKAEGCLRYLTLARRFASQAVLNNIYLVLIRPLMEYCCSVWSHLTVSDEMKLQRIQNRAARLVTGAPKYTAIEKLHEELGWDYLTDRRKYFRLSFYHQILSGKLPVYLTDLLPTHTHGYNTRQNQVRTFDFNRLPFKNSLLPLASREYNQLPQSVRLNINDGKSAVNLPTFKQKLKDHLVGEGIFKCPPPIFFRWGTRSGNALHAALRMGYTRLNSHMFTYQNIGDPNCEHCQTREDVQHFLLKCGRFSAQRAVMMLDIETALLTSENSHIADWLQKPVKCLKLLLCGDPSLNDDTNWLIFQVVQTFIMHTGRFKWSVNLPAAP